MWLPILAMFLSVTLSPPFGLAEASALAVGEDGSMVLKVTVEVAGSPNAILVRGIGPVDELPPVALAPQGDGTYRGIVQLNTTIGVFLSFEYIPPAGGTPVLTDLYTLVQLGVDPAALIAATPAPPTAAPPPTTLPEPAVSDSPAWGWLALAAGAGGLALLLTWLRMGRTEPVENRPRDSDGLVNADDEAAPETDIGIQ